MEEVIWIPIDPDNLPVGEVLAANFKVGSISYRNKLLGYLERVTGRVICDSEYEVIYDVTHYIDIHKFDI